MAAGSIPWTAIRSWCDLHGLTAVATRHAIAVILRVDAVMLKKHRDK